MLGLVEALWAAKEEYPVKCGLRKHLHDFYQLFYITYGVGNFKLNNRNIVLTKNMYLLIKPYEEHELAKMQGDKLEVLGVKFMVQDPALAAHLGIAETCGKDENGRIKNSLENLIKEGLSKDILYKDFINTYLYTVLLLIARNASQPTLETANDLARGLPPLFAGVSSAVSKYINEHYMQSVNLNDIARSVGYNKYYLCQAFKQSTGYTIGEYLQYIRVEKAKECLRFPDCSLKQLSERLGFGTIEQFTKIFKKYTRFSPGKYRKMAISDTGKIILLADDFSVTDYLYYS
ncbi:MAG: AraC family transcriptional regulator [Negativicutes bacterium]|nr:AraC family transcriptional regulator [Negativicutes bacterium]